MTKNIKIISQLDSVTHTSRAIIHVKNQQYGKYKSDRNCKTKHFHFYKIEGKKTVESTRFKVTNMEKYIKVEIVVYCKSLIATAKNDAAK